MIKMQIFSKIAILKKNETTFKKVLLFANSTIRQSRRDLTIKNEATQMFNRSQTIRKKRYVNVNVEIATKRITSKKLFLFWNAFANECNCSKLSTKFLNWRLTNVFCSIYCRKRLCVEKLNEFANIVTVIASQKNKTICLFAKFYIRIENK